MVRFDFGSTMEQMGESIRKYYDWEIYYMMFGEYPAATNAKDAAWQNRLLRTKQKRKKKGTIVTWKQEF